MSHQPLIDHFPRNHKNHKLLLRRPVVEHHRSARSGLMKDKRSPVHPHFPQNLNRRYQYRMPHRNEEVRNRTRSKDRESKKSPMMMDPNIHSRMYGTHIERRKAHHRRERRPFGKGHQSKTTISQRRSTSGLSTPSQSLCRNENCGL